MRGLISLACYALLAGAWLIDMLTPQLFVAAVLLNAPIALTSITLDRALTARIVVLALVADALAGWYNGYHESRHWNTIALANRVIVALSFVLVGTLSAATQRTAQRSAQLAVRQEQAARERRLREALEALRASVNPELVLRATALQTLSIASCDATRVYTCSADTFGPEYYSAEAGSPHVELTRAAPEPQLVSLLRKALEAEEPLSLSGADALSRFTLDALGAGHALILPASDRGERYAIIVAIRRDAEDPFGHDVIATARAFASQAAAALAQAGLFVELADKNEALAVASAATRQSNEVIRDLVYALSHDLRTPLSAARVTMQQALNGDYGELPAAYQPILERTLSSNDELARLAETLLLVARYESGDVSPAREWVDLKATVRDAVAELDPLIAGKSLQLALDFGDAPAAVRGDRGELRRIVINLVSNAVRSTPKDGHLWVRAEPAPNAVRLFVEDDGFGVPQTQRARLFQRFAAESRPGGGTGLGLYLVRRIVERHGGSVWYEPREPSGSRFIVQLPTERGSA